MATERSKSAIRQVIPVGIHGKTLCVRGEREKCEWNNEGNQQSSYIARISIKEISICSYHQYSGQAHKDLLCDRLENSRVKRLAHQMRGVGVICVQGHSIDEKPRQRVGAQSVIRAWHK